MYGNMTPNFYGASQVAPAYPPAPYAAAAGFTDRAVQSPFAGGTRVILMGKPMTPQNVGIVEGSTPQGVVVRFPSVYGQHRFTYPAQQLRPVTDDYPTVPGLLTRDIMPPTFEGQATPKLPHRPTSAVSALFGWAEPKQRNFIGSASF
eukprot:NODE_5423_length_677_cov_140.823248_g5048_i0.p1 GENE.NODE_5423_length_677_cov_140.823248_g5048_i0~~NODE_5423_length_677_cov_140.823248_g5048_i0.p1  ORF type:complete len:148 (-),score=16.24 NODE_5423_length_677_cov_140.823248_g5048_i0:120-563(-)